MQKMYHQTYQRPAPIRRASEAADAITRETLNEESAVSNGEVCDMQHCSMRTGWHACLNAVQRALMTMPSSHV